MPKTKKSDQLSWMDIEPLAAILCGKTEDDERDDIEQSFYAMYEVTLEQFEKII